MIIFLGFYDHVYTYHKHLLINQYYTYYGSDES